MQGIFPGILPGNMPESAGGWGFKLIGRSAPVTWRHRDRGNDTILAYRYVLGVGTPNVTNLLGLQGATPAGNPGTITNP